jgi:hypothetical protein
MRSALDTLNFSHSSKKCLEIRQSRRIPHSSLQPAVLHIISEHEATRLDGLNLLQESVMSCSKTIHTPHITQILAKGWRHAGH